MSSSSDTAAATEQQRFVLLYLAFTLSVNTRFLRAKAVSGGHLLGLFCLGLFPWGCIFKFSVCVFLGVWQARGVHFLACGIDGSKAPAAACHKPGRERRPCLTHTRAACLPVSILAGQHGGHSHLLRSCLLASPHACPSCLSCLPAPPACPACLSRLPVPSQEEFENGFGSHTPMYSGQTKCVRYFMNFERAMALAKDCLIKVRHTGV